MFVQIEICKLQNRAVLAFKEVGVTWTGNTVINNINCKFPFIIMAVTVSVIEMFSVV